MKWRLIQREVHNAAMNMALDESIAESVAVGRSMPTLRFYEWNPIAVSLGGFQKIRETVDINACRSQGVDTVRRITGGSVACHGKDVSFSVIAPSYLFSGYLEGCLKEASLRILSALSSVNVNAELAPPNRILRDGKRIAWISSTLLKGTTLLQCSLFLSQPAQLLKGIAGKEELSFIFVKKDDAENAIIRAFAEKECKTGSISDGEKNRASALYEKYAGDEWTYLK